MSIDPKRKLAEEVNNAMKMIGDEHVLCIIGNLRDGGMRFNELQRALGGINPTTLTARLTKLEADGIVDKKRETGERVCMVYVLTDKGKGILPIVNEIGNFADKFLVKKQ